MVVFYNYEAFRKFLYGRGFFKRQRKKERDLQTLSILQPWYLKMFTVQTEV